MIKIIMKWGSILTLFSSFLIGNCYAVPSVDYRIAWDDSAERYRVYMKPISAPSPNNNLSAQVTIAAPYQSESTKFSVTDLTSTIADATWNISSTIHSPTEKPTASYLSFYVLFNTNDAYNWVSNQEIEVFSFKNAGTCLGKLSLLESSDDFNYPNSVGTTPDNQITNTGWGDANENHYRTNYDEPADCRKQLSITKTVTPTTAVRGNNLVYTLTISNPSDLDAANVKILEKLPSSVSYVSDDSSGDYDSSTGVWNISSLPKNTSQTLNITVLVN